jgi:regulator of protease activity HflC (stomatin/prohibitin superfamily)
MNSINRFSLLLLLGFVLVFSSACTRIEPGWGGIVVDLNGGDKGVDDITIETGRIFYNPIGKQVYQFPHFMQRVKWTLDPTDGSPDNQEITFNSVEGTVVKTDVGFAYAIQASRIPHVFVALRTDIDSITDDYMRSQVRGAIAECAETKTLDKIYGAEKSAIADCALKAVNTVPFVAENFDVEYLTFIGAFRFDPAVQKSINSKIAAENEKKAAIETALGQAQAAREAAEGKADAIRSVANAERDAKFAAAEGNLKLQASLTSAVLQYQEISMYREKWNGEVPRVQMGASGGALLSLDVNSN